MECCTSLKVFKLASKVLKQNETVSIKSNIKRALEGFYIKETHFQCRQIRNWREAKNPNFNGSDFTP